MLFRSSVIGGPDQRVRELPDGLSEDTQRIALAPIRIANIAAGMAFEGEPNIARDARPPALIGEPVSPAMARRLASISDTDLIADPSA